LELTEWWLRWYCAAAEAVAVAQAEEECGWAAVKEVWMVRM
jgi:hypothetical protein